MFFKMRKNFWINAFWWSLGKNSTSNSCCTDREKIEHAARIADLMTKEFKKRWGLFPRLKRMIGL